MNKNTYLPVLLLLIFCFCFCSERTHQTATNDTVSQNPEVKAIFVNGDSIHYVDIGKGSPVIFIHGALGDYRGFHGQRDTFSKNHRVIVYSRRYALPDVDPISDSLNYPVTPHVTDLVEFIKALKLERAHLVGHSYGAIIALRTAIDHPELVRSITLCEPAYPSLIEDSLWANFVTKFKNPAAEAFKRGDDKKALEIFITGVIGDSTYFSKMPPEVVSLLLTNIPEARAIAFTKEPFPVVTCQELEKLDIPVLLVSGDKSPALFSATMSRLDRCISSNENLILQNASHGLQNDNPSGFNKVVLPFIDRH